MARTVKIPGPLYERARDEAKHRDISIGAVIDEWCRQVIEIDNDTDSTSESDSTSDTLMTDGGRSHGQLLDELTAFQRDIVYTLAFRGPQYGLGIKRALEALYQYDETDGYHEVNNGRLYPNLDTLVDRGLVAKSSLDDRTNEYELTDEGTRFVREAAQRWLGAASELDGVSAADVQRGVAKFGGES